MKLLAVLPVLVLLFSLGTAHAAVSLNLNQVPFQGSSCSFLSPQQIQSAYGFNQLYNTGINGSRQSIAIIDAYGDPNLQVDINSFDYQYGLSPLTVGSNLIVKTPLGTPTSHFNNWTAETALDVEVAHSLAPGAKIYLVLAPNESSLFNAINYTVNNLPVNTISISWGSSELGYSSSSINYFNSIFSAAEQKGINMFVATGDSGAYNSANSLNVNFPASSPNVVAVGGTTLSVSSSGLYGGEVGWNGSGGGQSQFFPRPSFQPSLSNYRMIPDVAFNAGNPICIVVNQSARGYYGTSVAAPSWAAIDALINQKVGGDKAFLLPNLYKTYSSYGQLAFNNITSGCNGQYCADGSYNEVTGLGSPKVYQLVQIISKSSYKLTFDPSSLNAVFNVNGINYTSKVSLNFTYGEKISLTAYSSSSKSVGTTNFTSFSGLVNTKNRAVSFFVNSSGVVDINYLDFFDVNLNGVDGNSSSSRMIPGGNTAEISSPARVNYSNVQYTLLGFRINNGPIIYSDGYNVSVYEPMNISFIWNKAYKTDLSVTPVSSLSVNVSFSTFEPLSNNIIKTTSTISGNEGIFAVNNTNISVYSNPQIVANHRYVLQDFSFKANQIGVSANFLEEKPLHINFYSTDGSSITPGVMEVGFNNTNYTYINSTTVWGPLSGNFTINRIIYKGVQMFSQPIALNSSVRNLSLSLPVSNVVVFLSTYFGVPVIGANVKLLVGNSTFSNSTGLSGKTVFYNIPQGKFNLGITAYGDTYTFNDLSSTSPNLVVSPALYQLYILLGVVLVVLIGLFLFEKIKHRKR